MKAEALEVVVLDNWSVQPVDRGPAPAAPDPRLLRSWQYQVTGKLAAAQVLADLQAEHIKSGERFHIHAVAFGYWANRASASVRSCYWTTYLQLGTHTTCTVGLLCRWAGGHAGCC